jgi:hypothetical protein
MRFVQAAAAQLDGGVTSVDATATPWLLVGPTRVSAWDPSRPHVAWTRSFRLGEWTTLRAIGTAEVAVIAHDHGSEAPSRWYGVARDTGVERWARACDWSVYDLALDNGRAIAAGYPHDGDGGVLAAIDAATGEVTRTPVAESVRGFARSASGLWGARAFEELLRVRLDPLGVTGAGACGHGLVACGDLLAWWRQDDGEDRITTRTSAGVPVSEVALRKDAADDWYLELAAAPLRDHVVAYRRRSGAIHLIDVGAGRERWCVRPPGPVEITVAPTAPALVWRSHAGIRLLSWEDGAELPVAAFGLIGNVHAIGDDLLIADRSRVEVWSPS